MEFNFARVSGSAAFASKFLYFPEELKSTKRRRAISKRSRNIHPSHGRN
jgi:hypothetical protein